MEQTGGSEGAMGALMVFVTLLQTSIHKEYKEGEGGGGKEGML